jgi:hypothetical protein
LETAQLNQPGIAQPAQPAQADSAQLSALLSLFAVPVLGFLGFGFGLALRLPSDQIKVLGLGIATGTLLLTVAAIDRTRPRARRNLLLSIFSLAYAVRFVFPVFVFYLGSNGYDPEVNPSPIPLTPDTIAPGLIAALVGFVVFLAGFLLPIGGAAARAIPKLRREWSLETALGVAIVAIPLGWAVLLASMLGLIPERAGSGVLGAIASGTTIGIGLIVLGYRRYRSRVALLLLLLMIPPTMLFNFFTSVKVLFLMPILMLGIVHIIVTRRLRTWWVAAGLIGMALFYPVAKAYREYMMLNEFSTLQVIASPQRAIGLIKSVASGSSPGEYLEGGFMTTAARLDGLGILSVILRDTGTRVPYQNGRTLSFIPLSYVPRLFWKDKPKFETGQWVTDNYGHGPQIESSTGCTWLGELYFNFGWIGLVVGMTLMGVWLRFLQDYFLGIDATIPALLTGVVAILTIVHGLEADLIAPTSGLVIRCAPILIAHFLVSFFTRPPTRLPAPI